MRSLSADRHSQWLAIWDAISRFIPVILLMGITAWLRLANLGYSDYQGDEIKALTGPAPGQGLVDYLLEQRKGPLQYLLTYLISLVQPGLESEFLSRLPFALAGILSVYVFYRLAELHFSRLVAILAALLFSINGLFIGLTRIVQYQSLVILFSLLALYCFSLALSSPRWAIRGIYAGMLFWAAAILSHYDAVFIAPFAVYLLGRWYARRTDLPVQARRKHLAVPALLAVAILGLFFIPYFLELRESTLQYWLLRLAGEEEPAGVPSSLFTFQLYNPLLATYFYAFFGLLSLPRLRKTLPVWLWFLFPWVILELVFTDPGTHVYTYWMPACILVAAGIEVFGDLTGRLTGGRAGTALAAGGAALAIGFLAIVSHFIFIDHTPEYPWEQRRILNWTIGAPEDEFRAWVFGFPYNRQWEAIGEFVLHAEGSVYYATNENKSIAGYYIPYPFDINQAGYYIHILRPQSFRDRLADDKIRYWMKNYPPVETFEYQGRTVAEIYLMPSGSVGEIREQGY